MKTYDSEAKKWQAKGHVIAIRHCGRNGSQNVKRGHAVVEFYMNVELPVVSLIHITKHQTRILRRGHSIFSRVLRDSTPHYDGLSVGWLISLSVSLSPFGQRLRRGR